MDTQTLNRSDFQTALNKGITIREALPQKRRHSALWLGFAVAIVVGVVVSVTRLMPTTAETLSQETAPAVVLSSVSTAKPERSQKLVELTLPAEIEAYQTTAVLARMRGYLKAWNVDRGDQVSAGQLLATIDAPEFDQELLKAQADLQQGAAEVSQARTELDQAIANVEAGTALVDRAEANLKLAAITVERFKNLEEKWAATRQQYDESVRNHEAAIAELQAAKAERASRVAAVASRKAAIITAEARVNSLSASVRRLKELESFKTISAPFAGTITRRFADVGALISDDGTKPLFTIIQDDVLRVKVNVPQTYAGAVVTGQQASVLLRERPGRDLKASVTRTARAIDPQARTLTVELELANAGKEVLPGSFGQVRFALDVENAPLSIPTSTLKFTKDGPRVVIVGADNRLHVQAIELGRDHGSRIDVVSGLKGDEALVVNPAESLNEGEQVATPPEVAAK